MSFAKVADLAKEFNIKIAEEAYDSKAPADKKAKDFSPEEQKFINNIAKQDNNQAQDVSYLDEKVWKRAKKTVKKYWKKYDEPWAVVYDVYRKMGGKPAKKSKKKSETADSLIHKYSYYGHIKNTTPPQNNVLEDSKEKAVKAVYNLVNSLHNEKQQGQFADNPSLEDSYNKLTEFYHGLLQKGKRPKFDLYDEAISDPDGFSILEAGPFEARSKIRPTKLDRSLITKSDTLKKYLNEANIAVRALKEETRT